MKSPDRDTVSKIADLEKIGLIHPKQFIGKNAYDLYRQHKPLTMAVSMFSRF